MKRILCLFLAFTVITAGLSILPETSSAQTATLMTASKATITAADSSSHYKQLSQAADVVTIEATLARTSGTVAGYVLPFGSITGVKYYPITTDTLTLTNAATQGKIWALDKRKYIYYKLCFFTTGTSVTVPSAYIFSQGAARPAISY